MPAEKRRIVVDLNYGADTSRAEKSLRRDVRDRVLLKLLAKPRDAIEPDDPSSHHPLELKVLAHRSHEAILVSARRGDGKTTFLTDILKSIEKGREHYLPEGYKEDPISLYSLGIIDPTLIETKQNIVVVVVDKIRVAAERAYRIDSGGRQKDYEAFRRELRTLAAGIGLLDGIGDPAPLKNWADADYVFDKGLDQAREAAGFERAFRRFVATGARVVGADAFVLAIDDVDTSFERGWPVLEALRKYFASPRLKIIMAGDLKLYNLLVRKQQWAQIGKELFDVESMILKLSRPPDADDLSRVGTSIKADRSYVDQIVKMVEILQDQYLVKVVRPENRVDLRPLLSIAEDPTVELRFRASQHSGDSEDGEYWEDVVRLYAERLLGIRAAEDAQRVGATLLRLPLRSCLQALAGAWPLIKGGV
jgi:hypothetical protein